MKISRPSWLLLFLITAVRLAAFDLEPNPGPPPPPKISAKVTDSRLEVTYQIPAGYHVVRQEEFVTFSIETEGYHSGKITYPTGHKGSTGEEEYKGTFVLSAPLERTVAASAAQRTLTVKVSWQMCDEQGVCLMPADLTLDVGIDPAAINATAETQAAAAKNAPPQPSTPASVQAEPADSSAWLGLMLLSALLGGMLLNLMPCVLPVLSIKALSLVKSAQNDRKEILKGALAYTFGVLACFAVLASVVIGVKSAGNEVGWGFQFQEWRFVLALAIVIWLFALSLFEVFVITLPGMTAIDAAGRTSGHWGSFLSGAFSVLLATPCTAPFLGTAMGYAFAQPTPVIMVFFLMAGLGLAMPFLVLGFVPGALRWIPKPGNWMIVFREAMAFLLAGTVVYLLDILYYQIRAGLFAVIWYLLLAAIAAWVYGKFANPLCSTGRRWVFTIVALLLLVAPLPWVLARGAAGLEHRTDGATVEATEVDPESGFLRFSPERVAAEIRAGKPVFIDFGAQWCATCRVNEHVVLYTDTIRNAFKANNVVAFRADYTNPDPVIAAWLKRYRRAGVPLYLLFHPGVEEPYIFPEVLTAEMVLTQLRLLKGQAPPGN